MGLKCFDRQIEKWVTNPNYSLQKALEIAKGLLKEIEISQKEEKANIEEEQAIDLSYKVPKTV